MGKTLAILAAGLGQRFGGIKQMEPVGPDGEILMYYGIYDAVAAGFTRVAFIIKHEIEEEFRSVAAGITARFPGIEFITAFQDDAYLPDFYRLPEKRVKMLGTVQAMLSLSGAVEEPFCVINADDYYGSGAFEAMGKKLPELSDGEAAMVGYYLKNTVTDKGAVTRGVCEIAEGRLKSVRETYSISPCPDGRIISTDDGPEGRTLDPDAVVSMNFWGFTPGIFAKAKRRFDAFLAALPEGELKKEYALPTLVDELIRAGELSVEMLYSGDAWMGMTYREDIEEVRAGIAALHGKGRY